MFLIDEEWVSWGVEKFGLVFWGVMYFCVCNFEDFGVVGGECC